MSPQSDPDSPPPAAVLPLVEERLSVAKDVVETGRVRVRTAVEERRVWVREDLESIDAEIERVPLDRMVESAPESRTEGDVLILPVLEEVLVVEKRLRLVEEIRIRQRRSTRSVETPVDLRRTSADVERTTPDTRPTTPEGEAS